MELNAKVSSLEDEIKLLKGEVKQILSDLRAAVLGQDNPFSAEPGQLPRVDPEALEPRPPIRVVSARPEGEEEEPARSESTAEDAPEVSWPEEEPPAEAKQEIHGEARQRYEAASAVARAAPREQESPPMGPPPQVSEPPPAARREATAAPPQNVPSWSLITVAGLATWAEDALKQVGPERLQILLDLCQLAGYLPKETKEALTRVTNLGLAIDDRSTSPSVNECLVILYQLDALMRGEEPGGASRGRASTGT